jgi:RES domain-containing protein
MLELRVHSPFPYPRTRWRFTIEVPDDALNSVAAEALPRGWDNLPGGPASKRLGDEWVAANSSLGLLVPSVVASEERNLILNPSHPRFPEVRISSKRRVMLDKRLYSSPTKQLTKAPKKKKQP